jgi:hypothetical protein
MKAIALAFLLMGSVVGMASASEHTLIFVPVTIPADTVELVETNIQGLGGAFETIIDLTKQPVWRKKDEPTLLGVIVSVRTDGLGIAEWKNMPLAQVETRVGKNVRPPDKQQIKVLTGEDMKAGYEPIPAEEP